MRPTKHVLAVAVVSCACALLTGCGRDDGVEQPRALPDVTGLTLAAAEQRLERINVEWTLSEKEELGATTFDTARESSGSANRALAGRRVVAQDPEAGYGAISSDVILLTLRR